MDVSIIIYVDLNLLFFLIVGLELAALIHTYF